MGFFDDDSFIGYDYNCDGKIDRNDDLLFMMHQQDEEDERCRRMEDEEFERDSWDSDNESDDYDF